MRTLLSFLCLFILSFNISTVFADQIRVNYRLKWLFNASVAGDIFAKERGYFKKVNLNVNVKEGCPEKDAIKELELGYADFGVASADQVLLALDKGADLVIIAQIFQINPMQWIYRAKLPEIKTLSDLRERHIGITFGGNDETIMNAMLISAGLKLRDVKLTGVRFDFIPFLRGQVEIWPIYRNSQGVILEENLARENEKVKFLNPADFGINFVANSIVTSGKMMKENPLLVRIFAESLLKSWEAAMDPANEDKVIADIIKNSPNTQFELCRKQLRSTRELVKPQSNIPLGRIDILAWQQTENIMKKAGLIRSDINLKKRFWKLANQF